MARWTGFATSTFAGGGGWNVFCSQAPSSSSAASAVNAINGRRCGAIRRSGVERVGKGVAIICEVRFEKWSKSIACINEYRGHLHNNNPGGAKLERGS